MGDTKDEATLNVLRVIKFENSNSTDIGNSVILY